MLATNVLYDAEVPALEDHVQRVVVPVQDRPEVGAVGVAGDTGLTPTDQTV